MNEVGGMEKFWVWVEYSNNLTFKMRKMGHCMFHDLINNNGITVAVLEVIPGWGSAKPTDKGFALKAVHSSPAGYKSKLVQGQLISKLTLTPRPLTISPALFPIFFLVAINRTQDIN